MIDIRLLFSLQLSVQKHYAVLQDNYLQEDSLMDNKRVIRLEFTKAAEAHGMPLSAISMNGRYSDSIFKR